MTLMLVAIFAGLLGSIPAMIAKSKGREAFVWWIYGTLLFIVALPHSLLLNRDQAALDREAIYNGSMRKCPACAELVRREAKICRYCQTELTPLGPQRSLSEFVG